MFVLVSYFLCGKYPNIAPNYFAVSGTVVVVVYFEIIIKYNEPEEGIVFYSIANTLSIMYFGCFKYMWIMLLYEIVMTSYVFIRVALHSNLTGLLSNYDFIFYFVLLFIIIVGIYKMVLSLFQWVY